MPGDVTREQPTRQLDQRVALADRRLARRTLATQRQPADQRNIFPGADLVVAVRAT